MTMVCEMLYGSVMDLDAWHVFKLFCSVALLKGPRRKRGVMLELTSTIIIIT